MAYKEFKDIKTYGEWFIKLLDNHHYCLRRDLYSTHLHLFRQRFQSNEHFYYREAMDKRIMDIDLPAYTALHHFNN